MNVIYILVMMFSIPSLATDHIRIHFIPGLSEYTTAPACFEARKELNSIMTGNDPGYIGAMCVAQDKDKYEQGPIQK